MKNTKWMIFILAAAVVFAGSAAFAMMGMMTGGEAGQCGMMQGNMTQADCPMMQGNTTQCPMTQNKQCSGNATDTTGQSSQKPETCPMAKDCPMSDGTKAGCAMASCDRTACICDDTPGNGCVDNKGVKCAGCNTSADNGTCPEECCAAGTLQAAMDISPGKFNLLGKGKYITVYLQFDENADGLTVDNIDKSTIYLKQINNKMCPQKKKIYPVGIIEYGDYDADGINDLAMKFKRQTIMNYLSASGQSFKEVSICVEGELYDGTKFFGQDSIPITGN